jgi:hypothetical protein
MPDDIVGIVLKLNPKYEDLDDYLKWLKLNKTYNIPKSERNRSYKHVYGGQWLMLYDPSVEALSAIGTIAALRPNDDPEETKFVCEVRFDPATLWFPGPKMYPLRRLERVFKNFRVSHRYRNVSKKQLERLNLV